MEHIPEVPRSSQPDPQTLNTLNALRKLEQSQYTPNFTNIQVLFNTELSTLDHEAKILQLCMQELQIRPTYLISSLGTNAKVSLVTELKIVGTFGPFGCDV